MLDLKTSIHSLLNPCKFGDSQRDQAYVQPEQQQTQSGGQLRFTFPQNETVDLSDSYIDLDVELQNITDGQPWILDFSGVVNSFPNSADAGTFKLQYDGIETSTIAYNATASDIEDAINSLPAFRDRSFEAIVVDTPATAPYITSVNNLQDGLSIVVQNFDIRSILPNILSFDITNQNLTLAGAYSPMFLSEAQAPTLSFPRLDYGVGSLIENIRVDFGGVSVINISDSQMLLNMMQLSGHLGALFWSYETEVEEENGKFRKSAFRVRLNVGDVVKLFKSVLPFPYIKQQMKIFLTLSNKNIALIQDSSLNGDYLIRNAEFHYSRLRLSQNDKTKIVSAVSSGQLVIPYISYSSFTSTLSAGSTSDNIQFNPSTKDLLGIIAVMRENSYIQNPQNVRKTAIFCKNHLRNFRLKAGASYFPLDYISSLSDEDVAQPIQEYINTSRLIIGKESIDQRLFFNYTGDDTDDAVWITPRNASYPPSFVIGLETLSSPLQPDSGRLCPSHAFDGIDCSRLSNVNLELQNYNLRESNTINIYAISQNYLVFGTDSMDWIH